LISLPDALGSFVRRDDVPQTPACPDRCREPAVRGKVEGSEVGAEQCHVSCFGAQAPQVVDCFFHVVQRIKL
jgi:hypothetical protein